MTSIDTLAEFARHYVRELRSGDREGAFHALTEADAAIVPLLIAEFAHEPDPVVHADLLRVIAEFRSPESIPFFTERLFDDSWKIALDFFVTQRSPEGVAALESARTHLFATRPETNEFRAWLEEAIEQATPSGT